MQVQKLVYLAHGYGLALLDEPLIYSDVQAWQWGPVFPRLYKKLSKFGAGKVTESLNAADEVDRDLEGYEVITGVWKAFGHWTGARLSGLTHQPNSPWSQQYAMKPFGNIDPESIKTYYLNDVLK